MNDDSNTTTPTAVVIPTVELPESFIISQWRISDGTFIMKGDVIAYLIEKGKNHDNKELSSSNCTTATNVQKPSYCRPSRRKKKNGKMVLSSVTKTSEFDNNLLKKDKEEEEQQKTLNNNVAATKQETTPQPKETKRKTLNAMASGIFRQITTENSDTNQNTTTNETSTTVIGHIVPCHHAVVINSLCAVCGMFLGENDKTATTKNQMISNGIKVMLEKDEAESISKCQSSQLIKQKKLSLVLDLDHTLLHATADPRASAYLQSNDDVRSLVLPLPTGVNQHHCIKLRPHVVEFLTQPNYEIYVYTAGTREYAEQITMILSRQLVNAKYDHYDILKMQDKIKSLELLCQQKNKDKKIKETTTAAAATTTTPMNHVNSDGINNGKVAEEEKKVVNIKDDEKGEIEKEEIHTVKSTSAPDTTKSVVSTTAENTTADSDNNRKNNKRRKEESDEEKKTANDSGINAETQEEKGSSPSSSPPKKRVRFFTIEDEDDDKEEEELIRLRAQYQEVHKQEKEAMQKRQLVFGNRIVSRTDIAGNKCLKHIFPDGGQLCVIVDDREDVWSENNVPPDNLLLVKPYHWNTFAGFADVNNASGIDLSKQKQQQKQQQSKSNSNSSSSDDKDKNKDNKNDAAIALKRKDMQLSWTNDIIKRVHKRYYDAISGDNNTNNNNTIQQQEKLTVPKLLSVMREEVLQGCIIVFSGLIPKQPYHQYLRQEQQQHPFLRYATKLGAKVIDTVYCSVTHVVAANNATEKVLLAHKINSIHVVKSSWLMECYWSLTKRDENEHRIPPTKGRDITQQQQELMPPPLPFHNSENNNSNPMLSSTVMDIAIGLDSSSSDDDDDDDDGADCFADSLWDE